MILCLSAPWERRGTRAMPPEAAGRSPPVPETPMYVEEIPSMGKLITLPFAALLRWMYSITGSYGVAIILFSLILKLILLPFQMKSKRSMVRMGRLSGKQAELQKQYAKNQQKYQEELAKLYQEEGVNPMSGCLWSFLPLFLLLPLYQIVYRPITHFMGLSEETMGVVREAAIALGFDPSAGNAAYEQVALTEFISREWDSMKNNGGRARQRRFQLPGDRPERPPHQRPLRVQMGMGDHRSGC